MPTSTLHWTNHRDAKRYNYLLSYPKGIWEAGDPWNFFSDGHILASERATTTTMPPLNNPRWEAFAQAIVKGLASDKPNGKNTQKAAYLAAGYSTTTENANAC